MQEPEALPLDPIGHLRTESALAGCISAVLHGTHRELLGQHVPNKSRIYAMFICGHGSKPMVPFWDRCTTHFSLCWWELGCSLKVRGFDP